MTAILNHAPRKKLCDQLDRLDGILDGLADGLNDAVADAVKIGVTQAVERATKTAIAELLSNPDIIRLLQGPPNPPPTMPAILAPTPSPSFVSQVTRNVWNGVCSATSTVGNAVAFVGRTAWSAIKAPVSLAARCVRPVVSTLAALANLTGADLALRPI